MNTGLLPTAATFQGTKTMKLDLSTPRRMATGAALLVLSSALTACGAKTEKQADAGQTVPSVSIQSVKSEDSSAQAVAQMKQLVELIRSGKDDEAIKVINGAYDINQGDEIVLKSRVDNAKSIIKVLRELDLDTIQVKDTTKQTYSHAIRVFYKATWKKGFGTGDTEDYTLWRANKKGILYMEFVG